MPTQDLKSKLDMLEQHIDTAEKHLKDKDLFSPDHAQTASKLRRKSFAASVDARRTGWLSWSQRVFWSPMGPTRPFGASMAPASR